MLSAAVADPAAAAPSTTKRPVLWPAGLIAAWDFRFASGPEVLTNTEGVESFSLLPDEGSTLSLRGPDGIFLDGKSVFYLPPDKVGSLALEERGDEFTILCEFKDTGGQENFHLGFRAGCHTEGGPGGARQWALYFSEEYYGGSRSVCTNIGGQDGPTPGYPFNKDYASTARRIYVKGRQSEWHMES